MRPKWGDDCAIALRLGHARGQADAVLRGAGEPRQRLLYALNGGRDEVSGEQVGPKLAPITGDVLSYDR
jgi:formate C-acetyltransferase